MPKYPGSQTQLGGEFVFEHDRGEFCVVKGPTCSRSLTLYPVPNWTETDSFKCLFVSRMHNTRAHAEVSLTLRWQKLLEACLQTLGLIALARPFR